MKKYRVLAGIVTTAALLLSACSMSAKDSDSSSNSKDLTMWANTPLPTSTPKWQDVPFLTGLQKQTGIKVDYQYPNDAASADQAFNLLLSEKKFPDMIQHYFIGSTNIQVNELIQDGVIRDLTKLLPKKAPHYWQFLKDHPDYDKAMKTDDGKYFGFGMFREDPKQTVYVGPIIRQDWLKEQHLSMPTNIAEFENVLKVFKAKYGATWGFTPDWKISPGLSGAFGAYGTFGADYYIDKDGQIQLGQTKPEWKSYITWLHKMYKEGLIDPDVLTMKDADLTKKIANNKIGAANVASGDLTVYAADAKKNKSTADWVAMPYPNQPDGTPSAAIYAEGGLATARVTAVTTSAKGAKLDKTLKWLDYAFTKKGNLYWNFGKEGKTWTMKDGVPTFKDYVLNDPKGLVEGVTKNSGMVTNGIGVQQLALDNAVKAKNAQQASSVWLGDDKEALKSIIPASVTIPAKQAKDSADIQAALDSYILENSLKFMTGEKSLNDFDSFVSKMNSMGLKKLLGYKQAAYDRYLKR